jgi:hypothetical protein
MADDSYNKQGEKMASGVSGIWYGAVIRDAVKAWNVWENFYQNIWAVCRKPKTTLSQWPSKGSMCRSYARASEPV